MAGKNGFKGTVSLRSPTVDYYIGHKNNKNPSIPRHPYPEEKSKQWPYNPRRSPAPRHPAAEVIPVRPATPEKRHPAQRVVIETGSEITPSNSNGYPCVNNPCQ